MTSIILAVLSFIIAGTAPLGANRAFAPSNRTSALNIPTAPQLQSISLTLGASVYPEGKAISVTVVNHLQHPIYAVDEKTDCSIVTLERRTDTNWQAIRGCGLRRMPLLVAIPSDRERVLTINPLSPNLVARTDGAKPGFGIGKYRIMLAYRFAPDLTATDPYRAYSKTFSVRPTHRKRP